MTFQNKCFQSWSVLGITFFFFLRVSQRYSAEHILGNSDLLPWRNIISMAFNVKLSAINQRHWKQSHKISSVSVMKRTLANDHIKC